ncbi:MAG: FkbM family methyltransferase [Anaerolineales bacterium]|nr:FkbM family methyltransferase [Anaerolineales bacterium]
MAGLRRWIGTSLAFVLARRWFQPLAQVLYRAALLGLNIGVGDYVATSGEAGALRTAARLLPAQPARVVFGVGANQGDFMRAALAALGPSTRVLAFEPAPQTFSRLARVFHASPQVELHQLGLSDASGSRPLYSDGQDSGLASLYQRDLTAHGRALNQVETVPITTLDAFCAERQISRIDYLKLDVEGHELSALRGARRLLEQDAVQLIQFEFGGCAIDARVYFRDLYSLLNERFRLYRILQDGLAYLPHYSEHQEVYATANFLAISRKWPRV